MGTPSVLGLDIGGANLKAATPAGRAVSVPFALWKQPDRLPAALAELVGRFPEEAELAVTMTGELCDCFETKRQGVNAILDATEHAAAGRPVRVWGTDGRWRTPTEARAAHLTVAAANWHALATFAGRYVPAGLGLLIDIGSTTTDLVRLTDGTPSPIGKTDSRRLQTGELVYVGVRRTPVFALARERVCAELFATTADVFVVLGRLPEDATDTDTANGRPLTVPHALDRLARVLGADREELAAEYLRLYADQLARDLLNRLKFEARAACGDFPDGVVIAGAGEFFARDVAAKAFGRSRRVVSLNAELGPEVSACAPAYAVAVLAAEGGR